MFRYPFGVQELWGIAARGNYDLSQHANASGVLAGSSSTQASKRKFTPRTSSSGRRWGSTASFWQPALRRLRLEEEVEGREGGVWKNAPSCASIPASPPSRWPSCPLLKNKPALVERASRNCYRADQAAATPPSTTRVGPSAGATAVQDEIGTPWCVTIDFETIEKDGTFTLRERDSMAQRRIDEDELFALKILESSIA